MFPPASDFMKSLYLFSLILSSHFIRSEPVKILLRGNLSPSLIKNIVQDYGHQAVAIMLSCNGVILNYAFVMYNKSISKIDIVQNIAKELPVPPVMSYFLCDCWYVSEKIINTFAERGFHTIGALKTNRILYPFGIRCLLKRFLCLLQCDPMQPAALSFAIVARVRRFGRYGRYRSSTATSVSAARICFFNSSVSL